MKEKTAIVTGANSGLGFETTKALASKGFRVIMACRNLEKAEKAKKLILEENPTSKLDIEYIDTSKFNSVRAFADKFKIHYKELNILVNNAGFMSNHFELSEDGIESQMATNFLGHFLLTGLLLDVIKDSKESRIVSLGSIAHRFSKLKINEINKSKNYYSFGVYSNTKLACVMFGFELDRKLKEKGLKIVSTVAHPGISITNISNKLSNVVLKLQDSLGKLFMSNMKEGAESIIFASIDKSVDGGSYYGPSGFLEIKGKPKKVDSNSVSKNLELAKELWEYAEEVTNTTYAINTSQ